MYGISPNCTTTAFFKTFAFITKLKNGWNWSKYLIADMNYDASVDLNLTNHTSFIFLEGCQKLEDQGGGRRRGGGQ